MFGAQMTKRSPGSSPEAITALDNRSAPALSTEKDIAACRSTMAARSG